MPSVCHCQTTGRGAGGWGWLYGPVAETRGSAKSKQSFKDGNKNNSDVPVAVNPSSASSTRTRAAARISGSDQKTHVLVCADFKGVSEAAFPVTPSHIANELELAQSICCPATSKVFFPSFFIFFFTLCWQHQIVFWLCCSCPVSPPVFFFISLKRKQESKGRSITGCSLLCQVDFKQVRLPQRSAPTPTQPCYCL